jgi:ankyrin repeat protein
MALAQEILRACGSYGENEESTGNPAWLLELIDKGADVNQVNTEDANWTALHYSAADGHAECVDILLQKGADPHPRHTGGATPLHYAAYEHHLRCVELLIAAGADVYAQGPSGTPLLYALINCGDLVIPCVELLIAAGSDINSQLTFVTDPDPPLFFPMQDARRDLVKLLLRAGAREMSTTELEFHRTASKEPAFELMDSVNRVGGWKEHVRRHRRVLAGLVCKCAKRAFPLDAAGAVVDFWCPAGGY